MSRKNPEKNSGAVIRQQRQNPQIAPIPQMRRRMLKVALTNCTNYHGLHRLRKRDELNDSVLRTLPLRFNRFDTDPVEGTLNRQIR